MNGYAPFFMSSCPGWIYSVLDLSPDRYKLKMGGNAPFSLSFFLSSERLGGNAPFFNRILGPFLDLG